MGRRRRRGPGRGRGEPAADGRRDRIRARAGGPDHRPRVLPAAAHARHALSLGGGRADGRGEGLRGPRRAGAGVGAAKPADAPAPCGPGRGPTSCSPGWPSPTRDGRRPPSTGSTWSSRSAGWSPSSGRPGPASRPPRTSSSVSSSPTRVRSSSAGSRSRTIDLAAWRAHRRLGPAAAVPLPRQRRGQHPARATGCIGRGAARGRARGGRRHLHRRPPARLRDVGRGGWHAAQRRAAPADRPGSRVPRRRAPRRPRRGDLASRCGERDRSSATRSSGSRATGPCSSCRIACASCRSPDTVAVIDQGRVVESGAPADLAARDGPYRRLLAADDAGQSS